MPKSGSGLFATVAAFAGNSEELKRAKYILAFLQMGSASEARRASGLSRNAHDRIVKMFSQRGHAFDKERPGRPHVYTDAIMEAAYEKLTDSESGLLSGRQLKTLLVNEGVISEASSHAPFMKRLRAYIMGQGHRLITNSVKTTFFITLTDVVDRLKYCRKMSALLEDSGALHGITFVDEVTLEESPHPKGNDMDTVDMTNMQAIEGCLQHLSSSARCMYVLLVAGSGADPSALV